MLFLSSQIQQNKEHKPSTQSWQYPGCTGAFKLKFAIGEAVLEEDGRRRGGDNQEEASIDKTTP